MAKPPSPSSDSQPSPLLQVKPENLKIGMYVDLNCSWFRHPFSSKTFKITTEKELVTIRSLGLDSVLVDPALSDSEKEDSTEAPDGERTSSAQPPSSSGSAAPPPTITRYQESLQQANAVYKQTLAQSKTVLHDIRTGSEAGLATAKEMVTQLTDLVMDDSTSSAMGSLLGAQDLDDINVLHAMNVTVLSMLVGRQFDLSHADIQTLGTAGLLHDIGDQQLPLHLRTRKGTLTAEDQIAFQRHVDYSLGMLAKFPGLPSGVTNIIGQHHERIDGSGYPSHLKGDALSLLSRILMVVDEYDRLVNAPDIRQNLTPTEALSRLYLTGKTTFSEEVVVALIQMLSVYPPGTVVELNDKSLGLVVSINLQARMRPLVILYDPTVDQDNPNIANLSQATHLSIVRSVLRNELSPDVSSYLNLARWTGYFLNSSMATLQEKQAAKG